MNWERNPPVQIDEADRDRLWLRTDIGALLRDSWQMLRRRRHLPVLSIVTAVALAVLYLGVAVPVYTATGAILIDPRIGQSPGQGRPVPAALLISDGLTVDSELRVLASREVTTAALRRLGPLPWAAGGEPGGALLDVPGSDAPELPADMRQESSLEQQRRAFMQGLTVARAGESFVIDITYRAPDPVFATRAVNTLIRAYQDQSGQQFSDLVARNRDWLSDRIVSLRGDLARAESAVAAYRRSHSLLTPEGALLPTEIALNAGIAELVRLRTQRVARAVEAEQVADAIRAAGTGDAPVAIGDPSRTMRDLDARLLELRGQEQTLLQRWDANAPAIGDIRRQIEITERLIADEYGTLGARLSARTDAIDNQVRAVEQVVAELRENFGRETEKILELNNLEREARAKRALYERMLEEFNSTSQLTTFKAEPARVIAWAVAPQTASAPDGRSILLLSLFAGAVLGIGAVMLAESLDDTCRRAGDIPARFGLPLLGVLPSFASDLRRDLPGRNAAEPPGALPRTQRLLGFTSRWPGSVGAETMRALRILLAQERKDVARDGEGIVIGITSSIRGEGKTTAAFNLAASLAAGADRVAILDCDPVSRAMTEKLGKTLAPANDLGAFLADPDGAWSELIAIPQFPALNVIGCKSESFPTMPGPEAVEQLEAVLQSLRTRCDYVIVDLPPVQGAASGRLLAGLCDRLIYAVQWGAIPADRLEAAMRQSGLSRNSLLGVLYTRANLARYRSYNRHECADYAG